ncbi:hypothetical protein TTHERM_00460690 (macronuclear) [Tetrahymena thermophila SB210]|uniref:Uncharacterized protein n=1 Tax=Tetrahymena thermophila (strain SB210) TaxID=312017 RepID=Q23Q15_TETTS|nr:hypothetical protein TTHERM_00460690 [Tetrahymena thermophila SB210]EAR98520.2 hypothetical protein TTHERM_00460690 [Tetrahymena thermophila SB210]|eukprot:XP_001018765.2 hypothetical protein TTHERM_00460690 [Tetrahymena thermophila SB210]
MTAPPSKGIFGDYFDNQKHEQFPSRFRKQDYSSPKFVQQQKLKLSGIGTKFQQLMDANLFSYDSPKSSNNTLSRIEIQKEEFKIQKSQSVNKIKNKQFIVFPKIQKSIRDQQMTERNSLFLQYASVPHESLLQDKSISNETIKKIFSQPYIHYQNVKKIRKISPESKQDHVCKKSVIIPYQDGGYSMQKTTYFKLFQFKKINCILLYYIILYYECLRPGLPNSQNRTKKLTNLSFTKMQWNITNYNANFALSKKEQEIREILKNSKIKKIPLDLTKELQVQDITQPTSQQGNKSVNNMHTEFNFFTTYSKSPKNEKTNSPFITSPSRQS